MGMNNRNDYWKDRQNGHGKGDFHANGLPEYRAGAFWGKSDCCNASVDNLGGKNYCSKCEKKCEKVTA